MDAQSFEFGFVRRHLKQIEGWIGQIRRQGAATAGALDQNERRPVTNDQRFAGRTQLAVSHPVAPLIGEDVVVGSDLPDLHDAVAVAQSEGLAGVDAHDDGPVEIEAPRCQREMPRLDLWQAGGAWILLVKSPKVARFAQPLAVLGAEFIGPQQLTFRAFPGSPVAQVEHFCAGGFEWQDDMLPVALGEHMAGKVGLVEAVGDNDHGAGARMIEPSADGLVEASIDEGDADDVVGVFHFQRVVNDGIMGPYPVT